MPNANGEEQHLIKTVFTGRYYRERQIDDEHIR